MAANPPFLSTTLLKETRSILGALTDATQRIMTAVPPPSPSEAVQLERVVLRYGAKVLELLEAQGRPLTERRMFETINDGSFPLFQQAIAEMVRRGLLRQEGLDPTFGDPQFIVAPAG